MSAADTTGDGQLLAQLDRRKSDEKEASEQLRVTLREYQGRPFIDLRVWFLANDNHWHPTKKGATIRRGELGRVLEALGRAAQLFGGGRPG
ncbi:MAG: transcriptional coactivator p15/PC4 family protein, partial [Acidobacteriota bacterium]